VIREYFAALTVSPSFRYVVITNRDGTLFGIMDAHRLAAALGDRSGPISWENFAQILERNDAGGITKLGEARPSSRPEARSVRWRTSGWFSNRWKS